MPTEGTAWQRVAAGRGTAVATRINFSPVRTKYVRITLTAGAPDAAHWTIQRLQLFEAADAAARGAR